MLLHAVLASQQLDDARLAEDAGGGDTEDMATDAGATIAAGQGGEIETLVGGTVVRGFGSSGSFEPRRKIDVGCSTLDKR